MTVLKGEETERDREREGGLEENCKRYVEKIKNSYGSDAVA